MRIKSTLGFPDKVTATRIRGFSLQYKGMLHILGVPFIRKSSKYHAWSLGKGGEYGFRRGKNGWTSLIKGTPRHRQRGRIVNEKVRKK